MFVVENSFILKTTYYRKRKLKQDKVKAEIFLLLKSAIIQLQWTSQTQLTLIWYESLIAISNKIVVFMQKYCAHVVCFSQFQLL